MHLLLSNAMNVDEKGNNPRAILTVFQTAIAPALSTRTFVLHFPFPIPHSPFLIFVLGVEIEVKPRSFEGHTPEEWRSGELHRPEGTVDRF